MSLKLLLKFIKISLKILPWKRKITVFFLAATFLVAIRNDLSQNVSFLYLKLDDIAENAHFHSLI